MGVEGVCWEVLNEFRHVDRTRRAVRCDVSQRDATGI